MHLSYNLYKHLCLFYPIFAHSLPVFVNNALHSHVDTLSFGRRWKERGWLILISGTVIFLSGLRWMMIVRLPIITIYRECTQHSSSVSCTHHFNQHSRLSWLCWMRYTVLHGRPRTSQLSAHSTQRMLASCHMSTTPFREEKVS